MRCGLIAKKLGMTRVWNNEGSKQPITVLHLDSVVVTGLRTMEKDGYVAVQLGGGIRKLSRTSKPLIGQFSKAEIAPRQILKEFRVDESALLKVGDELSPSHFVVGQKVDVTGISIGKGFAGGMKRHNFGGLRASHGVSVSHRSHGSTGQNQDPGKVFKGKKMAGHMGQRQITTQNLSVIGMDEAKNLLFVQGSVPGAKNGWVMIKDAVKVATPQSVPMPAGLKSAVTSNEAVTA